MLTVVTGNASKAKLIEKYLEMPVEMTALDVPEIQSLDLEEIVEAKACEAFRQLGKPVVVDDVSFVIDELNGLPGPLIKWFLKALDVEGLCRMADLTKTRAATITIAIGYFDGTTYRTFLGAHHGTVAEHARGTRGFGFDFIFIADGDTLTRGELDEEAYDRSSARRAALLKLREFLLTGVSK